MKTDQPVEQTSGNPRRPTPRSAVVLAIVAVAALLVLAAALSGVFRGTSEEAVDPCEGKGLSCLKDQLHGANDPCRYVRVTDAEKVLGVDYRSIPGRTVDKCFLAGPGNFSIRVVAAEGAAEYRASVRSLKDHLSVGTEAYWDPGDEILHVLVGETYLAVQLTGIPGNREKAIAVAGLALAKIAPQPVGDG